MKFLKYKIYAYNVNVEQNQKIQWKSHTSVWLIWSSHIMIEILSTDKEVKVVIMEYVYDLDYIWR